MRLGLTIVGDSLDNFIRYVQQADQAGVAVIGTGDSQTLYGELWVRCTLAGMHAARARWPLGDQSRHPPSQRHRWRRGDLSRVDGRQDGVWR